MPLYEYQCTKCGERAERIEKFSGPYLKKCPKCGGSVERLLGAPAIQFKGSGWYVTDYASKGGSGDSAKGEKADAVEKTEAKGSKEAKEVKEAKTPKKETDKEK